MPTTHASFLYHEHQARSMRGRGQASIEYLSTYTWAFLGLLVTVSTLNYFGIFEPSNYTPERCELGTQISCVDMYAETGDSGSNIYLLVKNNYPRDIVIESATITNLDPPLTATEQDMLVKPARSHTLTFSSSSQLFGISTKEQITYKITYRRFSLSGSATSHTVIGNSLLKIADATIVEQDRYCGNGQREDGEECDPPTTIIDPDNPGVHRSSEYCPGTPRAQCLSDCTCEEP